MYERDYVFILDDDPGNPLNVTSDFPGGIVPVVGESVNDNMGKAYTVDHFSAVTGALTSVFVHIASQA